MTTNIKVQRICNYCGNVFIALTTVTKYCSHKCASRAYKKRAKESKIENSNSQTIEALSIPIEKIKANEYLTLSEVAKLIRVSRTTLFRIIKSGLIQTINFHSKTIIAKVDLDDFILKSTQPVVNKTKLPTEETEFISFPDLIHLHGISESTLYTMVKRKQITKRKIMGTNYVPKSEIEKMCINPIKKLK